MSPDHLSPEVLSPDLCLRTVKLFLNETSDLVVESGVPHKRTWGGGGLRILRLNRIIKIYETHGQEHTEEDVRDLGVNLTQLCSNYLLSNMQYDVLHCVFWFLSGLRVFLMIAYCLIILEQLIGSFLSAILLTSFPRLIAKITNLDEPSHDDGGRGIVHLFKRNPIW